MKTIFGYFLIIFALVFMAIIVFPQFYSMDSSGRIDKKMPLKFDFLTQESSPIVILFFGYSECGDICPPALTELSIIYEQLDKTKVQVYFVNVLDTTPKDAPHYYAKAFHKGFNGIYLSASDISKVASKLNLVISKINDYEVNHSGYLYILKKAYDKKDYILHYIYTTRPFNKSEIVKDVNSLLKSRS